MCSEDWKKKIRFSMILNENQQRDLQIFLYYYFIQILFWKYIRENSILNKNIPKAMQSFFKFKIITIHHTVIHKITYEKVNQF